MPPTALLLIDIQNDYFAGGLKPLEGMAPAAEKAAALLARARRDDRPVFHVRHVAASSEAPFFRPGTPGADIHDGVAPRAGERVIEKGRPNAFHGTDLEASLHEAGCGDVVICGAMSQMCIDATARAAADLGFTVTVAEDACAASGVAFGETTVGAREVHAAIMAPLAASYATIARTDSLLDGSA